MNIVMVLVLIVGFGCFSADGVAMEKKQTEAETFSGYEEWKKQHCKDGEDLRKEIEGFRSEIRECRGCLERLKKNEDSTVTFKGVEYTRDNLQKLNEKFETLKKIVEGLEILLEGMLQEKKFFERMNEELYEVVKHSQELTEGLQRDFKGKYHGFMERYRSSSGEIRPHVWWFRIMQFFCCMRV